METKSYDVIIVGAGPAGMTAAVYCLRKGLRTLVISKDIGGQVNWTTLVENYMGFMRIEGPELMQRFKEQLKGENGAIIEDEAINLWHRKEGFVVNGKKSGEHLGKAIIVATGKRPKMLGVVGEESFRGKGVSYCSTCDAPLFRDASVVVVGGGNSGVQAVIDLLASNARQIYLVTNLELSADHVLVDKISNHQKVRIYTYHQVTAIHGDNMVTGVAIRNLQSGKEEQLRVEGIFIEIGLEPNSEFLEDLWKNNLGEVVIDCHCRTNISGIFAAGDVTHTPEKQIIVASGEGAKAAIKVWEYLMNVGSTRNEERKYIPPAERGEVYAPIKGG